MTSLSRKMFVHFFSTFIHFPLAYYADAEFQQTNVVFFPKNIILTYPPVLKIRGYYDANLVFLLFFFNIISL
jgi:hypothetical protein